MLATAILKGLGYQKRELSILLLDDDQIRDLNKTYLKRNRSTDVMAFPQGEDVISHNTIRLLGDVVISLETAQRQAGQSGKPLKEECAFLLIHGILHLLGYDHVGSVQQGLDMRAREEELFRLCKKQYLC